MKKICLLLSFFTVVNFAVSQTLAADGWACFSDTTGTPYNVTGGAAGTVVTPTTAAQFNSYAISSAPFIIQVSGTIDLSSISNHTVYVKSNKTIIGIGTSPTIYGHLDLKNGVSNIIIQNVNITYNANEGSTDPWTDGITIQDGTHNIWVNHCNIYNAPDGLLDISGGADFITVSWCKFYYEYGIYNTTHHFANLVGSSDSDTGDRGKLHITFHHNWWSKRCVGRMPRVRFGQVHIYNNYYDCNSNDYCIHPGYEAQLRVENNCFYKVDEPINEQEATSLVYASGNYMSGCTNIHTSIGGDTVFTPPYSYSLDTGADSRFIVQAGAGVNNNEPCAPAIPTGLKASATTSSITLDWNDNTETYLRGYNVYYSTSSTGPYTKLTITPITVSTYTHNLLVYGQTYYYAVSSLSTAYKESACTDEVYAIPRIYGDFNIDHIVNISDVRYLSDAWLCEDCDQTQYYDYDNDCMINFIEFMELAKNW
ncbi:MAG: hypothetical protein A2Y12_01975 [Planctomycetes bacterium GWF2_42_9]|nr:MAG: hypothetical protein A2Y12_01975 [Planctomycetes bacterium GWF2_42_9]